MSKPRAPKGIGPAGKRLWQGVVRDYDLTAAELRILEDCANEADLIDRIQTESEGKPLVTRGSMGQDVAAPWVQELRQHRNCLSGLLGKLKLPAEPADDSEDGKVTRIMSRSEQGKHAATIGWAKRRGTA